MLDENVCIADLDILLLMMAAVLNQFVKIWTNDGCDIKSVC